MLSQHGTLGAGTVTTVSLSQTNADQVVVHILKGATGPIYFTVDGSTPTVGGANTLILQSSGNHARTVQIPTNVTGDPVVTKLISASADGYSVEVF